MRGRISEPSWKSGPPEPKHDHAHHAIDEGEKPIIDIDGPSVGEAEAVEGYAFAVVRAYWRCHREGCDAETEKRYVYAVDTEEEAEDAAANTKIVDWDVDFPILGYPNATTNVTYSPQTTIEDEARGRCHGRAEPNPDVDAHRYDL